MLNNERLEIRDTRFNFRYFRPRILAALLVAATVYDLWLAIHPSDIDKGSVVGLIDLIVRWAPRPVQLIMLCAFAVTLLYTVQSSFWPCIRERSILIFDGRNIQGFDFWGRKTSILKSGVKSVTYRNGGVSINSGRAKIWIPLSLLDADEEQIKSIKIFLDQIVA